MYQTKSNHKEGLMEKKETRELNPGEMNKVSGGRFDESDGKCPSCKRFLEHIEGAEYWCINDRCRYYHVPKKLTLYT